MILLAISLAVLAVSVVFSVTFGFLAWRDDLHDKMRERGL